MEATPRPWHYDVDAQEVRDVHELIVADVVMNRQANGNFIVEAVNSHDKLVEAVRRATEYLHKYHARSQVYADGIMAMEACDAVLKEVEGV